MIFMLEIKNVFFKYGNQVALRDCSCELSSGIYGILGHNGAGKSTFFKVLSGLLPPSSGKILLDHKMDIYKMGAAWRKKIGYMPQQQGMYEDMTAWDFLMYIASLKCLSRREAECQLNLLLSLMHLDKDAYRRLGSFSGGMKQRVMVIQALLGNPEYIFLDEPTVGLDPAEQLALCKYIQTLGMSHTILWSTHIVSDISDVADRIIFLRTGQIILESTVEGTLSITQTSCLRDAYFACMEENND